MKTGIYEGVFWVFLGFNEGLYGLLRFLKKKKKKKKIKNPQSMEAMWLLDNSLSLFLLLSTRSFPPLLKLTFFPASNTGDKSQ